MKWLAVLLTIGLAYGGGLPEQVAGTPTTECPGADPTVHCFQLGGTLQEAEERITANAQALDLGSGQWFDTMTELFDGWDVAEPAMEGVRYTAFGTDDEWFLVMASMQDGIIIVNLTEAWASQP